MTVRRWNAAMFRQQLERHGCIACACMSAGAQPGCTHNGCGPYCPVDRLGVRREGRR